MTTLPSPLIAMLAIGALLFLAGVVRRLRRRVSHLLHIDVDGPYRHMRHHNTANLAWRPAQNDFLRRLLFYATGRRVTTDFLNPVLHAVAYVLLASALVPGSWRWLIDSLRVLKDDPLAAVVLLGASILLQDTMRNAVAGLELTTTHVRFDKNDRVTFHPNFPTGIIRHITSR
jgi:hypothetical protein